MSDLLSGADLRERLDRWVAEGLIDAAQAARIEAAEAARARPAVPRTPLVAEALGYAGGVLAIAARFLTVSELWPGIPAWAELTLAATACAALGGAGAALRASTAPASRRLHSVLWLMSTASLAAFTGLLAGRAWHASAAVLTATAVARLGPGPGSWGPGLGVWAFSALWGAAVTRGRLRPRATGYLAAGIGLLTGAELAMQVAAGHVLALATVGAALTIFVVGLILLGSAIWLARRRAHPR